MKVFDKSFMENGHSVRKLKPQRFSMQEIEPGLIGYLATLNAVESDMMEIQWVRYKTKHGLAGFSSYVVAWCLCDENNNRLFDSGDDEETLSESFLAAFNKIKQWDADLVKRGFAIATTSNGLSEEDIKELEKNSEATAGECGNGETQPMPASVVASG